MTGNEIKKAMECCIKTNTLGDCREMGCPAITPQGCSFYLRTEEDFEGVIFLELIKDALDLINRYEVENERLQKANERFEKEFDSYYAMVKSQAVEEYAERLKERATQKFDWNEYIEVEEIDNLKKEMTEPRKGKEKRNIKFKTGDYAKIIDNYSDHHFKIGTIVKLEKHEDDYKAFANGNCWWVIDNDLTEIGDEEIMTN